MKHLKMLTLAAVAAGALMAFIGAGTASASKLCSAAGDPCPAGQHWPSGTPLTFRLQSGTSALLVDTAGNTLDKCTTSEIKGKTDMTGSATETVTGPVEELTWGVGGSCTFTTKTLKRAGLEIHNIGNSNGTLTATGTFEVTVNSILGDCIYGVTAGYDLGELTEGKDLSTAQPATFHANSVVEEFSNLAACPDTARWNATYVLAAPAGTTLAVTVS